MPIQKDSTFTPQKSRQTNVLIEANQSRQNSPTQLIHFDAARRELALANSIDEVKIIRDQAEAIRQYIKQQKGSFEMQNQAAEIKLRAERRAGEMLKEQEKNTGAMGIGKKVQLHNATTLPTYKELGIEKTQAMRWQLEAEIPEEKFEQFIAETKAKSEEITSRAALGIAMKIKHEQRKQATIEAIMPNGLFQVIVIDPPWPYSQSEYNAYSHRVANPYNSMSIEEIMTMDIPADVNCSLWLWATNSFLHDAFHILEAWAFEYKTMLTWFKQKTGVGNYLRGQTEHCLLATIGNPIFTHLAQGTALEAKARGNSEKPDEFYDLVNGLCPGNKLDIFARKQREGWQVYGNQL